MATDEMLKLARFRILDRRNCNEAAKDKLLGLMADEIERLQKILRDWGICGWERRAPDVPASQCVHTATNGTTWVRADDKITCSVCKELVHDFSASAADEHQ